MASDENDSVWFEIMERYKDSVIQLISIRGGYNPFRPQQPPVDRKASGTGFLVDIMNGLVLTNAHVVSNNISLSGRMSRLGEYDLSLRVISICREKDVALCQLSKGNIEKILDGKKASDINMVFGDNMLLKPTSVVVTIGFPMGAKNIKFTTGVVSGFHADTSSGDEESGSVSTEEESPSFLQVTAPINPGNSGGPLLNRRGEIVGINSAGFLMAQSIGFAIGSRTVLGIYDELVKPLVDISIKTPYVVITPKYSFEYNRASPALLELGCNKKSDEGIYVKRVYPNSCFDTLKEGDIVTHIMYDDIFSNPSAFNVLNRNSIQGTPSIGTIDKFGDVTLNTICGSDGKPSASCRKLSIKEVFDMIPIGKEVKLVICRQSADNVVCEPNDKTCGIFAITSKFQYVPSTIRDPVYPRINPYKYIIVAGMSIGELTMNHIAGDDTLQDYAVGKKRFHRALVINQIFPDTTAYHTRVFKEGSIIEEVNGCKVTTIDELKDVLSKSGEYIIIVGKGRDKLVVKKSESIKEDIFATSQFGLLDYESPLVIS